MCFKGVERELTALAFSASICLDAPKVVLGIVPIAPLAAPLALLTDVPVLPAAGTLAEEPLPKVPVLLTPAEGRGLAVEVVVEDTAGLTGLTVEVVEVVEEGRIRAGAEDKVEVRGFLIGAVEEEEDDAVGAIEDLTELVLPVAAEGRAVRVVVGTVGLGPIEPLTVGVALTVEVMGGLEEAIEARSGARCPVEELVVVVDETTFLKGALTAAPATGFFTTTGIGSNSTGTTSSTTTEAGSVTSIKRIKERKTVSI